MRNRSDCDVQRSTKEASQSSVSEALKKKHCFCGLKSERLFQNKSLCSFTAYAGIFLHKVGISSQKDVISQKLTFYNKKVAVLSKKNYHFVFFLSLHFTIKTFSSTKVIIYNKNVVILFNKLTKMYIFMAKLCFLPLQLQFYQKTFLDIKTWF